jgi:condensin complex subunit 2
MLTPGFTSFRCSRSEGRSAEPPSLVVDTSFQAGASYNDQDIDDDDDDFYGGDDLDDDGGDAMESDGDPTRFHSMGADAATGAGAEPLDFPMEFLKSATGGTDLAYLDQAIFGCNWSGPGGTFKNSKSQKPDATKEKQPKEKFLLDFTRPVPASALAGGEAKETYTLSQGAIDNASEASTTMPEDHHYQLRDLLVLFSKPLIAPRSGRASQDVVDSTSDAGWYDYANDNDAENFCPDMGDDDDDDDDCPTESSMLDEDIGLVGVPQLVGKVPINYARAAKKVDVQVLKESIWNTIDADASCKAGKTKQSAAQEQSPKTFQSVMSGVSSHVPLAKKEMMKDVSVPFCFICLLHLANEKNLVLTDDKLGALNRLDITEDGLGKVASGSCDWKTASGQLTEITNRAAVEA